MHIFTFMSNVQILHYQILTKKINKLSVPLFFVISADMPFCWLLLRKSPQSQHLTNNLSSLKISLKEFAFMINLI